MRATLLLALARDPDGRLGGEDGIAADRGLAREHDRVGAIEHGIGHVARLGSRRARGLDHRLEHLRRHDRRDAAVQRASDQLLLDDRDFLVRELHPEVAARDHHGVHDLEDGVEVVDGGPRLDLRDDRRRLIAEEAAERLDVLRTTHERLRHVVDAELERDGDVGAVLLGERGRASTARTAR